MNAAENGRFSRQYRLSSAADFRRVFSRPSKVGDADITVLARANGLSHARLGLAIARKQLPRAVDRNRIKRLVRESFRHHRRELPGADIVVMVRRSIGQRDNAQILTQLEALWHRLAGKMTGTETGTAKPCKD